MAGKQQLGSLLLDSLHAGLGGSAGTGPSSLSLRVVASFLTASQSRYYSRPRFDAGSAASA